MFVNALALYLLIGVVILTALTINLRITAGPVPQIEYEDAFAAVVFWLPMVALSAADAIAAVARWVRKVTR